jgi:hypothetical protein
MTVVEIKNRWPEPNEFDVLCDACGQSALPDERQPYSDADGALEAADAGTFAALVREDGRVRCWGCMQDVLCQDDRETCDGGGMVQWNTSWSGRDPQFDMDAPCPGCLNCEFLEGLVDAKGEPTSGTKRDTEAGR